MSKEPFIEFMGMYDDEGNEVSPESIPRPELCRNCIRDEEKEGMQSVLCMLARCGHMLEGGEFTCHSYAARD
ncbi:hypothetical protein KQI65_02245 [bacterium]|nr:hypothetical protein [bacterium]